MGTIRDTTPTVTWKKVKRRDTQNMTNILCHINTQNNSYSSRRNVHYSSKYSSQVSEIKHKYSGSTRERRRDKKYNDKKRKDDFKVPDKFSIASSEYRKNKEK